MALEHNRQGNREDLTGLKIKVSLADAVASQARNAEAEGICREILPALRTEYQKGTLEATDLANALSNFAVLRRSQGNSGRSRRFVARKFARCGQNVGKIKDHAELHPQHPGSDADGSGEDRRAVKKQRESVAALHQTSSANTADFGYAISTLGGFLSEEGNFAEANANLIEGEEIYRRLLGDEHLWLAVNLRWQAYSLYRQSRPLEAQDKIEQALKIYPKISGPQYINFATALMIEGLILNRTGKVQKAEEILRETTKMRDGNLPKEHFLSALAGGALGECLTSQKRFAEAEPILLESYRTLKKSQGSDNPRTNIARQRLVALYEACGRPDDAERYRSELASP
ncbi:MAG TPA: tetratricopeptide repeat protein [Candidatus Udaeobacter sp.]|nr:tetratricopeptide repeat protein [Candidatus Udaeobacter sp.]